MRLQDRVALVAGGDSEQGRAVAVALARHGAHVAIWARDGAAGAHTVRAIEAVKGEAHLLSQPFGRREDAVTLVTETLRRFGRLDTVVNLGNPRRIVGTVVQATDAEFEEEITADLRHTMWLAQAAIPEMARTGGGSILIFGSILYQGVRGRVLRSLSKAGITGLTRAMAADHGAQKIRVNAVLPGPVSTSDRTAELIRQYSNEAALKELTSPDDVANAVVFLASDEGRNITGLLLPVDGGRSLGWF